MSWDETGKNGTSLKTFRWLHLSVSYDYYYYSYWFPQCWIPTHPSTGWTPAVAVHLLLPRPLPPRRPCQQQFSQWTRSIFHSNLFHIISLHHNSGTIGKHWSRWPRTTGTIHLLNESICIGNWKSTLAHKVSFPPLCCAPDKNKCCAEEESRDSLWI